MDLNTNMDLKFNDWIIQLQESCKPSQLIGSAEWWCNIYLESYRQF